ncbi:hypothetical protein [Acrocarpospora sp. B8E8]|uniref:hypothetical protein n=1 Tax=Acrocarpospora sp. B8E8 TaxID=3153572 RepID=UPI00325CAA4E
MDVEVRGPDREETAAAESPVAEGSKGKLFHRHEWLEIERIGNVVTSQCLCGKSKTRVK